MHLLAVIMHDVIADKCVVQGSSVYAQEVLSWLQTVTIIIASKTVWLTLIFVLFNFHSAIPAKLILEILVIAKV